MGCCFSSDRASRESQFVKSPSPENAVMEEAVKEVLPETATVPPAVRKVRDSQSHQIESPFIKFAPLLDFSTTLHQNGAVVCRKPFPAVYGGEAEVSEEVSDIGSSLSEGVSASTEKRGNNNGGELRRRSPARSRNRSFSGEVKREKPVGRSPGRRSEPSPNRVIGSGYGRKKDSEESSGRRSRSPVTRVGPGPGQARKTGRSPGRVGSGLGDRTRKVELDEWAPTSNELLENPLVSLECFIFL